MVRWAGLILMLLPRPALAVETVATAHYRLEAETSRSEAEELARVLEAAWPEFARFFGAEPKLGEGERLKLVFCATHESWIARLKRDGIRPPKAGGYYSPGHRTAYAWRQPTRYFTRCLLLHEATHQFHYLARTGNRPPAASWYVEGLAEYLSRHYWDGRRLTLGVVPGLTLEDSTGTALRSLREGKDLEELLEAADRPISHALVRCLAVTDRKVFERLAARLDRGAKPDRILRSLGGPKKLTKRLLEFLPTVQEPLSPIFNEWEATAPDRFVGVAGEGIVSACRVKGERRRIEAVVEAPEAPGWRAGLLLDYGGRDDYLVALVVAGRTVRVDRRRNGRWIPVAAKPCPKAAQHGRLRLAAHRRGPTVSLRIEGKEIGAFEAPSKVLGLAIQGGPVAFRDVRWE